FWATTYAYDVADRLTSETLNGTARPFTYDDVNEVVSDGLAAFSFDLGGNRDMAGYSTGDGNQTLTDGTRTYSYDAEGNLVKKSKGADAETWTYGYDHDDRLLWAEQRATDGGALLQRVAYKYDAFGNRIERDVTSGGTTTVERYGYDGADVWADLDGGNN